MRELGAEPIDYTSEDLFDRVMALTNDHGADVCADMIGGEGTETMWTCMAREGRYVAVGFNDDPESGSPVARCARCRWATSRCSA